MSIKGRRLAILGGATAAVTALTVGGPSALAAPPTDVGEVFTVDCPGVGEFTVVTPPGGGRFTPAFVVGTGQVLIPYRITAVATVPGEEPFEFDEAKKGPVPADAMTCGLEGTITEDGFTATITGTVVVVVRGAPE
jgi:hypothetical protein